MTFSRVSLLDVEPDFGAPLSDDEQAIVRTVSVPVTSVPVGSIDVDALLQEAGAFAVLLLEGMILQYLTVGGHTALRLLGPGDLLVRSGLWRPGLLQDRREAAAGTSVALLDDHVLLAIRRFPRLVDGLQIRLGEQHERLAAQLAICQMPRVEDRVLSQLWLLAGTWGRVTPSGIVLPLALTHDTIGELIGARRSTVSLALAQLVESGALIHQDHGWLLLREPGPSELESRSGKAPEIVPAQQSGWWVPPHPVQPVPVHELMINTVNALRQTQLENAERVHSRLGRAGVTREHSIELRRQVQETRRARQTTLNGVHDDDRA